MNTSKVTQAYSTPPRGVPAGSAENTPLPPIHSLLAGESADGTPPFHPLSTPRTHIPDHYSAVQNYRDHSSPDLPGRTGGGGTRSPYVDMQQPTIRAEISKPPQHWPGSKAKIASRRTPEGDDEGEAGGIACGVEGCRKTFKLQTGLKSHMRIHSKVRPYECKEGCSKSFKWRSSLSYHLKLHKKTAL
mmetsp:Transcript_8818/g.21986  ORF Transcript_8818/g.21986 Transcript_8818/m.21986 type:complete len:188 (+) Transcript_8818:18-581(+)